jgi:hypothetical protein
MNRENIHIIAKVVASDTEALYDIAKSKGINMPHPALGIFKSVLAEIEKPNGNGVRLGTKATEAAVSTLIGTQINRNHLRTDNVLGHTIDAVINKDKEIEIICVFFKDIYEDEWEEAKELFSKGKLTMSFELSADVESQDKLADGTKRLNDYYFTGAGLLFGVKPACKKARVFEIATKKLQEKLSMERQSLIFANNQNSQKSILEVLNLMADEVKKIEEVKTEPIVAEAIKVEETVVAEAPKVEEAQKLCPKCNEPMEDDECAVCNKKKDEEAKVEVPVVEAKVEEPVVAEAPVVEAPKVEETAAAPVVAETAKVEDVVVVTETTQVVTDTMSENSETIKVETEVTKSVNDQVKEERKEVVEVTYTYAQMEEVKAGYEKEIQALKEQLVAKEKEVETIKADLEVAKKVKVEAKEEPEVLSTGHKKSDVSDDSSSPIAKILKNKKAYRK